MGETASLQDNDNVTVVKYGGMVHTQIRRFGKTMRLHLIS